MNSSWNIMATEIEIECFEVNSIESREDMESFDEVDFLPEGEIESLLISTAEIITPPLWMESPAPSVASTDDSSIASAAESMEGPDNRRRMSASSLQKEQIFTQQRLMSRMLIILLGLKRLRRKAAPSDDDLCNNSRHRDAEAGLQDRSLGNSYLPTFAGLKFSLEDRDEIEDCDEYNINTLREEFDNHIP